MKAKQKLKGNNTQKIFKMKGGIEKQKKKKKERKGFQLGISQFY